MTIEEKLKNYILTKHKSIREFVKCTGLPYSTVDGILKRGIANSSIGNILIICKTLQISADELANGKIVPITKKTSRHIFIAEIPEMLDFNGIGYLNLCQTQRYEMISYTFHEYLREQRERQD